LIVTKEKILLTTSPFPNMVTSTSGVPCEQHHANTSTVINKGLSPFNLITPFTLISPFTATLLSTLMGYIVATNIH
ncbi:hypothetical protein A4A49_56959, partial [Nicotiana attenuata]